MPPEGTVAAEAVSAIERSAEGCTVIVEVEELLPGEGSRVLLETEAVLVIVVPLTAASVVLA